MKERTKSNCIYCGRLISISNMSKHIRSHENGNFDKYNKLGNYALNHDGLICQFCGKECKNRNSLSNHERLCKNNPNKQIIKREYKPYGPDRHAWNKGLTAETDSRVKKYVDTYKKNYKDGKISNVFVTNNPSKKPEYKEKLSEYSKQSEFWKYKRKHVIEYNGFKFDSTYEVNVVKSLDENNIKWEKPKSFTYIFNDKEHTYTADIYLVDYDIYLDPKNDFLINDINPGTGYNDVDKINAVCEQNNIRVLILDKFHLNWDSIKEMI